MPWSCCQSISNSAPKELAIEAKQMSGKKVQIEALFIYPIKSCKGTRVSSAELTPLGLKGDRLYGIVDARGRTLTQREVPMMALIHPDLPTDEGITLRVTSNTAICEIAQFFVPRVTGDPELVQVLGEPIVVEDQGPQAASWLQCCLRLPGLRLVRMAPESERQMYHLIGSGPVAFPNTSPLVVTTEASLAELNRRVAESGAPPVPLDRFRPNVHLSGCDAFDEDDLSTVLVDGGKAKLLLRKPCFRCPLTTVDQETGKKGGSGEPLVALRQFRTGRQLHVPAEQRKALGKERSSFYEDPRQHGHTFFGQNSAVELLGPGSTLVVGSMAELQK